MTPDSSSPREPAAEDIDSLSEYAAAWCRPRMKGSSDTRDTPDGDGPDHCARSGDAAGAAILLVKRGV
jgi:hypothetical protein